MHDVAMYLIDAFYQALSLNEDKFTLATKTDHILRAKKEGKVSGLLSIEEAFLGSLAALRMFYKLGVRAMRLT